MHHNANHRAGFGSVTNADIAEELGKQGYKVAKSQIRMPNGPIKTTGESTVGVQLHTDVVVDITVTVLGLNLLGDALREATDPTLSHGKDPLHPPRGSIRHVPEVVS